MDGYACAYVQLGVYVRRPLLLLFLTRSLVLVLLLLSVFPLFSLLLSFLLVLVTF